MAVDDVDVARQGDEDVADLRRVGHGHHAEAVHHRFQRGQRVDFRHDHLRAHAARAARDAAPAPSIARAHDGLPSPKDVRRARDAVQRALPRAVAIVEHVLRVRFVHRDDRVLELALRRQRAQPHDARRRLLGAADDADEQVRAVLVQPRHDVRAVVHRALRLVVQHRVDVPVVRLVVLALDGERRDAVLGDQRRSHIVLRTQRVRGAERDVGAAVPQRDHQVRRFRRHVQARGDAQPVQRLLFREPLADLPRHRHLPRRPLDAPDALFRQLQVSYIVLDGVCCQRVSSSVHSTGALRRRCSRSTRQRAHAARTLTISPPLPRPRSRARVLRAKAATPAASRRVAAPSISRAASV